MSSWTQTRKEERMMNYAGGEILSDRSYNLALGGTVFYGLAVNAIICMLVGDSVKNVNPMLLLIGYAVSCFIGIMLSKHSDNPIVSFIGYNLVVVPIGFVLSLVVSAYIGAGMGNLVFQAIVYTTVITFCMVGLSITMPDFFSRIGGILLASLFGLIIAEILALFFFPGAQNIFSWIGAAIFSLYIGYDYWKSQEYPKTLDNAVDSALDIYLDIINLFLRILEILGNKNSKRN